MLHKSQPPQQTPQTVLHLTGPVKKDEMSDTSDATSLQTALVAISNGDRVVRARAVLDSGAGVCTIQEDLARELQLKRTYNPIYLNDTSHSVLCKFSAEATLQTLDGSCKVPSVKFVVHPKLKPLSIPACRDRILADPRIKGRHVADPELGGDVQVILNLKAYNHFLKDYKGFWVDDCLVQETTLGLVMNSPLQDRPKFIGMIPAPLPVTSLRTSASCGSLIVSLNHLFMPRRTRELSRSSTLRTKE